jgi:hypothetical protein
MDHAVNAYERTLLGIKTLIIKLFDGGDYEYSQYTFINEYIRNQKSAIDPNTFVINCSKRLSG